MEENNVKLSQIISEMVESGKLKFSRGYTMKENPFIPNAANNFEVTIKYGRKQYSLIFSQGKGLKGLPTVESVLGCLINDISFDGTFEDFCGCFGYDTDSRKALDVYKACEKERKNLVRLFGDDLEKLLSAENDI